MIYCVMETGSQGSVVQGYLRWMREFQTWADLICHVMEPQNKFFLSWKTLKPPSITALQFIKFCLTLKIDE